MASASRYGYCPNIVPRTPPNRLGDIVIDKGCVAVLFTESFTFAVNKNVAATVGVPEMTPVEGASTSDVGSEPEEIDHVYDPTPPVAVSVCEYGTPTTPLGRLVVV